MQTLVRVESKEFGFTFRTFYGTWQRKHATDFVKIMEVKGIKAERL